MQERNQPKTSGEIPMLTQEEAHQVLRVMGDLNAVLLDYRRRSIEELGIDLVIDVWRERDPEKRQGLIDKISAHFGWS